MTRTTALCSVLVACVGGLARAEEPPSPPPTIEAQLAELRAELAAQRRMLDERTTPSPSPETLPPLSPLSLELPEPRVMHDASEIPLERMLSSEVSWTGLGSFKYRIPRVGISAYVHGLTRVGMLYQSAPDPPALALHEVSGSPLTFDLSEVQSFIGAEFRNVAFVEFQLNIEHVTEIHLGFGQIDLRIYRDLLLLRAGEFLVPIGDFNVYPDPIFHYKLPEPPLFLYHVVPYEWAELGLQLMGRYSWREGRSFGYAVYIVNGLNQPQDPRSPTVSEGGQISLMQAGVLDVSAHKAYGARLTLEPVNGLAMGASFYTGAYTQDGHRALTIGDFDIGYRRGRLTLRAETAVAFEQITGGMLTKIGAYALASFRVHRMLEPVLEVEWMTLDGPRTLDRTGATAGLLMYPFPETAPTIVVKAAYSPNWDGNGNFAAHRFVLQVQAGF